METHLNAMTREGRHVLIVGDPYLDKDSRIWIDGLPAEKVAAVRRLPGFVTIVETNRGKIAISFDDDYATLNDEPLYAV